MEINLLKPATVFQDFTQTQQGHSMNKSSVARSRRTTEQKNTVSRAVSDLKEGYVCLIE
jgi:hypothetical protein